MRAILPFATGLAGVAAALAAYATAVEPYWLHVARRELPLTGLDPALDGLSILHLSDLHVRPEDWRRQRLVRRAAAIPADVVALTGDFGDVPSHGPDAIAALGTSRGRVGTFAVLGNHDGDVAPHVEPHRFSRDTSNLTGALLESAGATVLVDESIRLDVGGSRLWIVGVDDPHTFFDDVPRALNGVPPEDAAIVLAHSWEPALAIDRMGPTLLLCGHTHGGQVRLPFMDAPLTNTHHRPPRAGGLFKVGKVVVHISQGLGGSHALRLLVRPQAVVFSLRASP